MVRRAALVWSLILSLGVAGGCQAILQFDEDKLDSGPGGGTAGAGALGGGGSTANGGTGMGASGGSTAECQSPADCPDTGSECIAATCDGGKCGTLGVEAGMPSTQQTAGDCKVAVCDGSGGIVTENDGADTFDDGKDCTVDACNAGTPESTPAPAGASCDDGAGKVCDGMGACVGCLSNADCDTQAPKCVANACVPASCDDGVKNGTETGVDCGGACGPTCASGQPCNASGDCASGVCTNNTCAQPTCSDNVLNGAETDTDCGGSTCPKCGPNKDCDANSDCAGNQCTGAGGTCVPNCNDGVKNNVETGVDCGGGTCAGCPAGGPCGQDNDCASTAYCAGGTCNAKKSNGATCAGNNQCASGACTDGVCCNTACGGTCQACNLPGAAGTCSPIAAGQDPVDECAGSTVCDGGGACKKAPGQTCAGSSECALGNCVDGYCCNASCGGACQACNLAGSLGSCASIPSGQDPANECTGAITCNGSGACGAAFGNGTACDLNGECQSGTCADGVCCNTSCGGTCKSCNLAGSAGTCANIPSGQDPANECAGATTCNGAGTCTKTNGSTCASAGECQSGFCVDGVCCNTSCGGLCQACNVAGAAGTCAPVPNGQDPGNECAGNTTCDGAGACGKLPQGSACGAASECSTGFCVDGYCCDNACTGLCKTCDGQYNFLGNGTCGFIECADPYGECPGSSLCQLNGTCNTICF